MSDKTPPEERYCTFHRKVILLDSTTPESGDSYRVCAASLPIVGNDKPCANSFCIHSVLAMALAKPALSQRGMKVEGASQAELQRILLDMGIKDHAPNSPAEKEASKACFVATACFGDPCAPEVVALRHYRDHRLARHSIGRLAIRAYYAFSPRLASWLQHHPTARSLVRRRLLQPLVRALGRTRVPERSGKAQRSRRL